MLTAARFYKPECNQLSQEIVNIYKDPMYLPLPMWVKERIATYAAQERKFLVKEMVEMFYLMPDGRKVRSGTSWDNYTEAERNMIRQGHSFPLVSYWLDEKREYHSDGSITITRKPTDKVYYK